VLVSTHDEALFAADRPRRLVLRKGQLIEGGVVQEVAA